jgi:hypothetical protein
MLIIIIILWAATLTRPGENRRTAGKSVYLKTVFISKALGACLVVFLGCFIWRRVALCERDLFWSCGSLLQCVVGSGAGLVLSSLCKRAALSRFIHKRGGGAGGGGGARRPVESWRCSRDEVMLVDCWEPAMGIKVMKGHMQKRGESTFGST